MADSVVRAIESDLTPIPRESRYTGYYQRATIAWERGDRESPFRDLEEAIELSIKQRKISAGTPYDRSVFFTRMMTASERTVEWRTELEQPRAAFEAMERVRGFALAEEISTYAPKGDELHADLVPANGDVADWEKVVTWANDNFALVLEYFVGDNRGFLVAVCGTEKPWSKAYSLVVDDKQSAALGIAAGPLTSPRLAQVLSSEAKGGLIHEILAQNDVVPQLHSLATLLLPCEVQEAIRDRQSKRIVVIADGIASSIPFEALVTEPPGQTNVYLLDADIPVSYCSSSRLLLKSLARPPSKLTSIHASLSPRCPSR